MRIIAAETMRNCRQDSAIGVGLHVNSNDSVTHDYIIRLAFCGYMTVLFCYQELYVHFTVYRDLRVQPMVNRSLERGKKHEQPYCGTKCHIKWSSGDETGDRHLIWIPCTMLSKWQLMLQMVKPAIATSICFSMERHGKKTKATDKNASCTVWPKW